MLQDYLLIASAMGMKEAGMRLCFAGGCVGGKLTAGGPVGGGCIYSRAGRLIEKFVE